VSKSSGSYISYFRKNSFINFFTIKIQIVGENNSEMRIQFSKTLKYNCTFHITVYMYRRIDRIVLLTKNPQDYLHFPWKYS